MSKTKTMKNSLLTLILILSVGSVLGQSIPDTIYYNAKWKNTTKKEHVYFRTITKDDQGLFEVKDFWSSGEIQMSGKFSSLDPETQQGQFVYYNKNGALSQVNNFKDGIPVGKIKIFDSEGKFVFEYILNTDSLDNANTFREAIVNLRHYTSQNLVYPENLQNDGTQGIVYLQFFVGDEGKIQMLSVLKSDKYEFSNEAIRVLKSFKGWPTPIYKGKTTLTKFILPITFRLY